MDRRSVPCSIYIATNLIRSKQQTHQDLFDFQAVEISGDFSPHGKSSVKEVEILKIVTGESAE